MTKSPNDTGAIIDFLDHAYAATDDPDRFDSVLEATRSFFFDPADNTPITPRLIALDQKLAPHIARIEMLIEQSDDSLEKADVSFGQFTVASGGRVVAGNPVAQAFFDTPFPCDLDALGLNPTAADKLKGALTSEQNETLVLLSCDTNDNAAAGLCRRENKDGEHRLVVSMSHIEWSAETVTFIGNALDLTEAETNVLAGHLRGLQQTEIATQRGRSVETIKAQTKTILRKSGCTKMSEVTRLGASIALMRTLSTHKQPTELGIAGNAKRASFSSLARPENRTLAYFRYGAKNGAPVVFFHGSLLGPFFTDQFITGLRDMGVTLYGPSRPGFGTTTPAAAKSYDDTTIDDTMALIDHHQLENIILVGHQGGVSHAFRCAARLSERVKGMVMIGAGIPIDQKKHVARMNRFTRIGAQTVIHAPAVMEMIVKIAISNYNRRGRHHFFNDYFAGSSADVKAMRDPEIYAIAEMGLQHLIEQGPKAFVTDGKSQMDDWNDDFNRVSARASWVNAQDDPVMGAEFVRDYVTARTNHSVEIVPQGGYNLLHLHPEIALNAIRDALSW